MVEVDSPNEDSCCSCSLAACGISQMSWGAVILKAYCGSTQLRRADPARLRRRWDDSLGLIDL